MAGRILAEASMLVLGILLKGRNTTQEPIHRAEPILSIFTANKALSRQRGTVQYKANVLGSIIALESRVGIQDGVQLLERSIGGARPDLRHQSGTEGGHIA